MQKNKKKKSLCKQNIVFLKYLHELPLKRRNKFIRNICNKSEIQTISELVLNFLQNNINCSKNGHAINNERVFVFHMDYHKLQ